MWKTIANAIESATGEPFSIDHTETVTGGDINLAFKVSGVNKSYFVKINDKPFLDAFEAEAYSLKQLSSIQTIYVPQVIALGVTLDKSFLVLEWLTLKPMENNNWYALGEQLAKLHKISNHGQFGWQSDNYIGTTIQVNRWQSNWREFFAEQRIGMQLQLLKEKSIYLGDIDHLVKVCHDLLLHHQVSPSLVHGDLWQGNIGCVKNKPVIFDPACYYGDREVDVAMTELFGQLPKEFYQGYQEIYPVPEKYSIRKHVYNFYHILNHANLFGGVYVDQSQAYVSRLLSYS